MPGDDVKPLLSAAAVVPRLPDGRVLVGVRTGAARSWPGYLVFPGGAVEPDDGDIPLVRDDPEERVERAAGLRELGEESGVWLLARESGERPSSEERTRFTTLLDEGARCAFALRELGLVLDDRKLLPMARWDTPPPNASRFSVRQMLLQLDEEPVLGPVRTPELDALAFLHPHEIHARWRAGTAFLLPPIRYVVLGLCAGATAGDDLPALARRVGRQPTRAELERRDVVEAIDIEPLRTPTLPPATHTNAVMLGANDVLLVDPATPFDDERARFDEALARRLGATRSVAGIVLTHHHHDHIGDVERLREKLGVPVMAHAETAKRVPFVVDRLLEDGDVLVCGGEPARRFRVVATPGHAPGHICLFEENTALLIAGDMVAGVGSILIDPPEGHMATYLDSLAKLAALEPRGLVPAHGPLLAYGKARLLEQIAHRKKREDAVVAFLTRAGPSTIHDIVLGVYGADTPETMLALAARSVLAILEMCAETGRAIAADDRWAAR